MSCLIKVNSNTIELTVHTSCYCVLDLLCVNNLLLFPWTWVGSHEMIRPHQKGAGNQHRLK